MVKLSEFIVPTNAQTDWLNITGQVQKAVTSSGISEGICVVFTPHK